MPNGNGNKLFGLDGKSLIDNAPVGVVVLKVPRSAGSIPQQLLAGIAQVTHCNIIILPMEYELLMGEMAAKEIQSIHQAIHAIEAETKRRSKGA